MTFEHQITDYHCVPAALKNILSYMLPEASQIHQLDLGALLNTDIKGTSLQSIRNFLQDIDISLETTTKNQALFQLERCTPILVTYNDSKNSAHCSVITKTMKKGPYNEDFIILDDPYYGKGLEMPLRTFLVLNPNFYLLRK